MKCLTKLLLIHWHYFSQELIEFGDLNFLTGKNASGKSTIIDALQLILLGDTSGSFFNKAASGRGNRTLKGYLMGELGDDEASGFRCLRNGRFTSYIAMEFFDTERKRHFTVGCCFDIYSENDITKLFFLYDGEMHANRFIHGDTPMDITALRAFLKGDYAGRSETTEVGRDFRAKLYGKLGGLRERFAGLLKKAVSFNPDVDIHKFISDFVCDEQQAVDVSHMQENIRSYKRLEAESAVLEARIALLNKIIDMHQTFTNQKNQELLYAYLVDRAAADIKSAELVRDEAKSVKLAEQLNALEISITDADRHLSALREQRDTLNAQLLSDGGTQALERLDRQIAETEASLHSLHDAYDKALGRLAARIASWRSYAEGMCQKLKGISVELLQQGLASRIQDICLMGENVLETIALLTNMNAETILQIGEHGFRAHSAMADSFKRNAIELTSRIQDEQEMLVKQRAELVAEQQSLKKGVYRFPQNVLDLKAAVASRLRTIAKRDVNVRIVAEAAEIMNDRWRNVIEGYLHTQKYYLLAPSEYFKEALRVYDTIKRQKSIYSTGIVDIEKLKRQNPIANRGSLAEEIETDDIDVRVFIDYTLGRVQKCERVGDLQNHRTAVTDEGMLYQNFVVRAIHPERWMKPAIGQGAIQKRLAAVKLTVAALVEQIAACAGVKLSLEPIGKLPLLGDLEIESIMTAAKNIALSPALEADLASLQLNRAAIDTSIIDSLKKRIAALDGDIVTQDRLLRNETERRGRLAEALRRLHDETLPGLRAALHAKEAVLSAQYNADWLQNTGIPRYQKELSARNTADAVFSAFPREQSRAKNAKDDAWESLLDLRRNYNEAYKMGFDIRAEQNDAYAEACCELTDNKLPDYLARIEDMRKKAFEQFQEDFISRLQNNLSNAKRQLEELNSAIKGSSFGEERYRFRADPKPEYKRYHDMIMDEMITWGGYNLFSMQFNTTYKDEIEDLFRLITNEDGAGGGSAEYERRVHEFTDFRTYLSFALESVGQDGVAQRLSKTLSKKSGGETQTPFYVAVLASFAQLYRMGRDKNHKTSRLIIFDEAFSKMDGERIIRSIELLRKFEFQVILSAPPDKIGDIATLVDKNLCVFREGKKACVRSFDKNHSEDIADD